VFAVDRSGRRPGPSTDTQPPWMDTGLVPDGQQIAYMLERQRKPNLLYVMRADGTHKRRVRSLVDVERVSWQPRPTAAP
jgi:Tol biopolymer transport system component